MAKRIPAEEAFQHYVALGPERSYERVADEFGVTKRGITNVAIRDGWADRLAKVEAQAREKNDRRAVEALAEMDERHLKIARALQGKALEALREQSLANPRDVIRALDLGVRQERLIRGEPSERTEMSVEEVTKREMRRWLEVDDDQGDVGRAHGAEAQQGRDLF